MNKLVIGTVQLGIPYGIANVKGVPEKQEAFQILETAVRSGISFFDTAHSYGSSETIIGEFCEKEKTDLHIITKLPSLDRNISEERIYGFFRESLDRLRKSPLYCYMVHDVRDIYQDKKHIIQKVLQDLKKSKLVRKIGVSTYEIEDILFLLDYFDFDIIQIPFNIFDQRLLKDSLLTKLKEHGKEVHARSVFLQGSIFLDPDKIPPNLKGILPYRKRLMDLAREVNLHVDEIALLYVYTQNLIDHVLIGIELNAQLIRNLEIIEKAISFRKMMKNSDFSAFSVDDSSIIDPRRW